MVGRCQAAVQRDVDLVVLNDAPPTLARHIMTTGRRVLLRDVECDHAHLRLVLSRAADLEPFLRWTRAVKLRALAMTSLVERPIERFLEIVRGIEQAANDSP